MKKFSRKRDRLHDCGLIYISDEELAEQSIADKFRIGYQIKYNGVVHSIRGISQHGILIWKLGEKGPT